MASESTTGTRWTAVAFGLALAALAAFHQFKLPPVLPVMLGAYGYDRVLAGGFMSVFAVAGLVFSLGIGRGVERRGMAPYLWAAFILFLCGEALTLAAPQHGGLVLLARGLEGIGYAVCAIIGPLLANRNAGARNLPLVVGLTAAWIPIGQVSANLLSLPIVERDLWRPLWWIGIALTLALAAWALHFRQRGDLDTARRRAGATDKADVTDVTVAQRRALVVAGLTFALWSGQYHGYMTWLPQFLVEVHGFGARAAVLAYTLPAAAVLILCVVTGAVLRAGVPLAPLFVASISVQVVVWLLVPVTGGGPAGILSLIAYGVAAGITPVCLFAMPSAIMGRGRLAAGAFGIVMTGRNLGVLVGPVLLAQAVSMVGDWRWVWPLFGGLTLMAAVGAVDLIRRLRRLSADAKDEQRS
jgi:MFS family permease